MLVVYSTWHWFSHTRCYLRFHSNSKLLCLFHSIFWPTPFSRVKNKINTKVTRSQRFFNMLSLITLFFCSKFTKKWTNPLFLHFLSIFSTHTHTYHRTIQFILQNRKLLFCCFSVKKKARTWLQNFSKVVQKKVLHIKWQPIKQRCSIESK